MTRSSSALYRGSERVLAATTESGGMATSGETPLDARTGFLPSRFSPTIRIVASKRRGIAMLTTRSAKRDKVSAFNTDLMFDILDEGRPIGSLVFDKKAMKAAINVEEKAYTVARVSEHRDERLYQALIRVMTGSEKPPPNPWALKDASGRTLALGERVKQSFAVSRGEESFSFRKVSRPYHLYRQGSEQSLGSVGQEKFFTRTLHMRLPPESEPPFQVFLLALVLNDTMQRLDTLTT